MCEKVTLLSVVPTRHVLQGNDNEHQLNNTLFFQKNDFQKKKTWDMAYFRLKTKGKCPNKKPSVSKMCYTEEKNSQSSAAPML